MGTIVDNDGFGWRSVSDCRSHLFSFTATALDFSIEVTPLLRFSAVVLVSLIKFWPAKEINWDADDIWFLSNVGDPANFNDCGWSLMNEVPWFAPARFTGSPRLPAGYIHGGIKISQPLQVRQII